MLINIRCPTCNKCIASRYDEFIKRRNLYRSQKGLKTEILLSSTTTKEAILAMSVGPPPPGQEHDNDTRTPECRALDELGYSRYCCRTQILTSVDLISVARPSLRTT